ncbi:3-hydroxyacyl-CoA dehydrogenase, partial [Yersinia pestis]
RKTGKGFYAYTSGSKVGDVAPTLVEKLDQYPSVWLGTEYSEDLQALEQYLQQFNIQIEQTDAPSADALILIATYGED